jgi:hypothetical protein
MGFYSCASTFTSGLAPFLTTYAGENDGRSWSPLYDNGGTISGTFSTPGFLLSATGAGTVGGLGSLTSHSSPSATTTTGSSGSSNNVNTTKKTTKIGPIIGGVVAGLLVIGLIAFAIIFLCMKKRQSNNRNQPVPNQMGQAPGGSPMDAASIPLMQQQPMQQQPMYAPQGGYAQDPRYSYYVPGKDGLKAPTEYSNSIPPSPAPMYPPQSPPPPSITPQPASLTPTMPMASPVPHGPPPGVYEAGGLAIQPSPQIGAVSPVSAMSLPGQSPHPHMTQPAPVELGTNYAIPTRNPQGAPVFEAQ